MLDGLRDIHLPDPVSWWPPAPGWWILLALAIGIPIGIRLQQWRRAERMKQADFLALAEITVLRTEFAAHRDPRKLLSGASALIRRVAMTVASRDEVAALTGDDWLDWLDQRVQKPLFSGESGRLIADAHYRPSAPEDEIDGEMILDICEQWVTAVFKER